MNDELIQSKIEAIIATCDLADDGETPETRQKANTQRIILSSSLDDCRSELDDFEKAAREEGKKTGNIKGLREKIDAAAASLALRPIQQNSYPFLRTVHLVWRALATLLSVLFIAFVVSIPLVILSMVENQLFVLSTRRRNGSARESTHTNGGASSKDSRGRPTSGSGSDTSSNSSDRASPMRSRTSQLKPTSRIGATGTETEAQARSNGRPNSHESDGCNGDETGRRSVSSVIKRLDAQWLMLVMGIHARAEGMQESRQSRPAMLLFAHVSTLDAFIILGTFPRAFCAVVKEELFMVPIVGWIMASHGGMPINRGHRDAAVQALQETAERARELELFIAMAPEGTRSKTGHLGEFKKGALHVQEQLQWPVIPVTIRGAYELFPPKAYFNQSGKVVVHFHTPIEAAEIKSREGLSQRLRLEMLKTMKKEVPDAGIAPSPARRLASFTATCFVYCATAGVWCLAASFSRREGVSFWALVTGGVAYTVVSTLFVYYVYAKKCFSWRGRSSGSKGGTSRGEGKSNGSTSSGGSASKKGAEDDAISERSSLLASGAGSAGKGGGASRLKDR